MAFLRDSHAGGIQGTQRQSVSDFSGGLNLADPPLQLKKNQLLEATNWQYSDTGDGIETRDPLIPNASLVSPGFRATFLPPLDGVLLVVVDGSLYSFPSLLREYSPGLFSCADFTWMRLGVWNCSLVGIHFNDPCDAFLGGRSLDFPVNYNPALYSPDYVGDMTGELEPIGAMWGDSAPDLLIASGGKLQVYRYSGKLETMEDSPVCTYVTKRDGRVLVNDLEHSSRLVLSGVGDPANWKNAPEDGWIESDSVWIDVGYKSGGGISSIATLSKDMIVWKDNGTVYRLTGSYPDWAVYEIGRNVWNMNPYCPLEAGGDLYFPDRFYGFSSIETVIQYGEMRAGTVGYEVNKVLSSEMDIDARMWAVPSRGEVWVKTNLGSRAVYVYKLRLRAWTVFEFPAEIMGAVSIGNLTYVSLAADGENSGPTVAHIMGPWGREFVSWMKNSGEPSQDWDSFTGYGDLVLANLSGGGELE